jgi:hypothetical protein
VSYHTLRALWDAHNRVTERLVGFLTVDGMRDTERAAYLDAERAYYETWRTALREDEGAATEVVEASVERESLEVANG